MGSWNVPALWCPTLIRKRHDENNGRLAMCCCAKQSHPTATKNLTQRHKGRREKAVGLGGILADAARRRSNARPSVDVAKHATRNVKAPAARESSGAKWI